MGPTTMMQSPPERPTPGRSSQFTSCSSRLAQCTKAGGNCNHQAGSQPPEPDVSAGGRNILDHLDLRLQIPQVLHNRVHHVGLRTIPHPIDHLLSHLEIDNVREVIDSISAIRASQAPSAGRTPGGPTHSSAITGHASAAVSTVAPTSTRADMPEKLLTCSISPTLALLPATQTLNQEQ